jgi:hypothetical protein
VATRAKSKETSNEDILSLARERFRFAEEQEAEIRKDAADDLKFSAGEQWDPRVKNQRDLEDRPCLTINRLPQFIRQITNDQRQNRPAIKVSPVDDKADVETAKIFQGMIRHIEYASNADTAYDTAFDSSARAGYGYFRIITDYCDPMSFDQEIRVKRVPDRFAVRMDPTYHEPDGSDANWAFIEENISKDEYKAQYPDSDLANMSDWASLGDTRSEWVQSNTVRVVEYFYKEYREAVICILGDENKTVIEESELSDGMLVAGKRKTLIPSVKWVKTNGHEILDQTDWPGKWIPIIPVLGEELHIEGKRILSGVVRHAKDPQRMYNVWKSYETETITLAPKAPWIVDLKSIEGQEATWRTANTKNHAYLPFNSANGTRPGPQRNLAEPPVAAITNAAMYAADDLKATTGIYDAALGAKSNENSGIAIQRRNNQSQTANFHLVDNLSKSIRHGGRIIVDLIPKIYDTARAVRILGEDKAEEVVMINQIFERNGKDVHYDVGSGKYDVVVDTGPSFETKRQEAVASMIDMSGKNPQIMQVAGDIMIKNMDWPGAQEIAERLRKTLPPNLVEENGQNQQIPPQVQQQMGQMNQLIEQLTSQLKHKTEQIETKTLELESRERIEMAKLQVQSEIALAQIGSKESIELLAHEIEAINQRLQLLHMSQPISQDFEGDASGPDQAAQAEPTEPMPTGGPSPGQPYGVNP